MNRKNGDELCDLVRNHALILEGIINKKERGKRNKIELIDSLIKRNELFSDALWTLRSKHVYKSER